LGLTRSLQSLLFEISPQSPLILVLVAVLLIFAAVLGCFWPALRATKADISKLLRSE
jgi:ABC-type antimicrobial peptide transport system permease subunit